MYVNVHFVKSFVQCSECNSCQRMEGLSIIILTSLWYCPMKNLTQPRTSASQVACETMPISHLWQDIGQTGVVEAGFRWELPHTDQLQQISPHLAHLQTDVAVQRQNLQQHVTSPQTAIQVLEKALTCSVPFLKVTPTLHLKQFQCWSDWPFKVFFFPPHFSRWNCQLLLLFFSPFSLSLLTSLSLRWLLA